MFKDCEECFGTGVVFVDAHSHWVDVDLAPCPVCDGEGVYEIDDDDIDEGEGDDDAE